MKLSLSLSLFLPPPLTYYPYFFSKFLIIFLTSHRKNFFNVERFTRSELENIPSLSLIDTVGVLDRYLRFPKQLASTVRVD